MAILKYGVVAAIASLALAVPQNTQDTPRGHPGPGGPPHGPPGGHPGSDWRSKIKNVVVLVEENRSFDTFAGGLTYANINGLAHHNYCNSM